MPTAPDIEAACRALRAGGLVGLPTETVYGLAADAENEIAVRRIFAVKGRPSSHPLIVHVPHAAAATRWASNILSSAKVLMERFWPGPLTLVLERSARASDVITGGQDSIALRVPAHPVARALLEAYGTGLAAPSANRYGRISPTCAQHVRDDLGNAVDVLLDGGPCAVGVESTIVDARQLPFVVLRDGGITREALDAALPGHFATDLASSVRVPGSTPAHYAPRAGLLLFDTPEALAAEFQWRRAAEERIALVAPRQYLGPHAEDSTRGLVLKLVAPDAMEAQARALYGQLREADAWGADVILWLKPQRLGLGLALNDRLWRASQGAGNTEAAPATPA